MSSSANTTSTPFNFEEIFNAALTKYRERTGKDLRNHPLASKIDNCDNPDSILNIFQEQAQEFDKFRKGNANLVKWLKPVVNVLHAISTNKAFIDKASHVSPQLLLFFFLTIYSQGSSTSKCSFLRYQYPVIRAYLPCYLRPTSFYFQNY